MENVVSTCFVVANSNGVPYPTIFLKLPSYDEGNEILFPFPDPFTAKNFIRYRLGPATQVFINSRSVPAVSASNE